MIELIKGNCRDIIGSLVRRYPYRDVIIVSDPPFNIHYKYRTYKDDLSESDYLDMLADVFITDSVIILYPEMLYKFAVYTGNTPNRVVSWVYNSNTPRQHRDIAFFGVEPDFKKVRQPYKNPNDKRIKARIANGDIGGKLYDWWNVNQVKNVSKDKTEHPCQMPLEVMMNIIGILPEDALIIDPFMGSGTTGVACKKLGRDFIGIEIDPCYLEIANNRIMEDGEIDKD